MSPTSRNWTSDALLDHLAGDLVAQRLADRGGGAAADHVLVAAADVGRDVAQDDRVVGLAAHPRRRGDVLRYFELRVVDGLDSDLAGALVDHDAVAVRRHERPPRRAVPPRCGTAPVAYPRSGGGTTVLSAADPGPPSRPRAGGGRGRPARWRTRAGRVTAAAPSGSRRGSTGTCAGTWSEQRATRSDHSRSASPIGTRWSRSPWITSIGVRDRVGVPVRAVLGLHPRGQLAAPVVRPSVVGTNWSSAHRLACVTIGGEAVGVPGDPVGHVAAERAAHRGRARRRRSPGGARRRR